MLNETLGLPTLMYCLCLQLLWCWCVILVENGLKMVNLWTKCQVVLKWQYCCQKLSCKWHGVFLKWFKMYCFKCHVNTLGNVSLQWLVEEVTLLLLNLAPYSTSFLQTGDGLFCCCLPNYKWNDHFTPWPVPSLPSLHDHISTTIAQQCGFLELLFSMGGRSVSRLQDSVSVHARMHGYDSKLTVVVVCSVRYNYMLS